VSQGRSDLDWLAAVFRELKELQRHLRHHHPAVGRRRRSPAAEEMERLVKGRRRKPPEAGLPVPAEPPRGPKPLAGGAAAPLEFDS
jgi:hypothetical protein